MASRLSGVQREAWRDFSRRNSKKFTSKHLFQKKPKWDLLRDKKTNKETKTQNLTKIKEVVEKKNMD